MHRITARATIMLLLATFATGCDASRGALAQTFSRASTSRDAAIVAGAAATPGAQGTDGASVAARSEAGTGELPDTWPSDVQLPPGSQVGATASIVTGDASVHNASGSVALPVHVVRDHFDDEFADWEAGDAHWRDGVASWRRGLAQARVVVGDEGGGSTGFTIRID